MSSFGIQRPSLPLLHSFLIQWQKAKIIFALQGTAKWKSRHCRSGTEKITHWGEVVRKNVLCLDIMRWYPIVFTHFSAIRIKFAFIYIIKTFSTFLFIVLIVRFSWQNDKEQWQNCLHINLRLFIEGWNTCVK